MDIFILLQVNNHHNNKYKKLFIIFFKVKPIKSNEQLTFNYLTTEWEMNWYILFFIVKN